MSEKQRRPTFSGARLNAGALALVLLALTLGGCQERGVTAGVTEKNPVQSPWVVRKVAVTPEGCAIYSVARNETANPWSMTAVCPSTHTVAMAGS